MDTKNQPEIGDPVFDGKEQVGKVGHVYAPTSTGGWNVLVDGINDTRDIQLVDLHESPTEPTKITGQHFELA